MKYLNFLVLTTIFIGQFIFINENAIGQQTADEKASRWQIAAEETVTWNLDNKEELPHKDNIEMSGKRVAGIVTYAVDTAGILTLDRQVFFPQLQPFIKESDPGWFIYRAYLKDNFKDDILPKLFIGDKSFVPGKLESVSIKGFLEFKHHASKSGMTLTRSLFPSMDERLFTEQWTLENVTKEKIDIKVGNTNLSYVDYGQKGKFERLITSNAPEQVTIQPGQKFSFDIQIMARMESEAFPKEDGPKSLAKRKEFLEAMKNSLILETPDNILNTLFAFSKIRASESIFESKLGLIHSPGGGRYYLGIWANDQAEYINPFFPYLGYDTGNISAVNTYKAFAGEMNPEYSPLRYAFEIEGNVPPFKLDRGDAAMIAYGASQFALAYGEKENAKTLWPLIEWCLTYCHKQLNASGVVKSASDEMEGRIETGDANLSTSSLYYGALKHALDLGKSIGISKSALKTYAKRANNLEKAIENFFGSHVEGLDTYKYYESHKYLRHWICLPLVVGIHKRKEATIEALFERLWTENGVHVEKNTDNPRIAKIFWDRGTLYALRGTLIAGATEISLKKLQQFSKERLIGKRVPYVVEAYPEGNMAHLSAESALYCRVFIEGMFGINPTGLKSFTCNPRLPKDWDKMALRNIKAFNKNFDVEVKADKGQVRISVIDNEAKRTIYNKLVKPGMPVSISF